MHVHRRSAAAFGLTALGMLLFVAFGASATAVAQTDRPVWRVAYNAFPPYSLEGENRQPVGYAIDIVRELASMAGARLEFVAGSNPGETVEMIARGEADLHVHLADAPERRGELAFSDPIDTMELGFYAKKGSALAGQPGLPTGARVGYAAGSLPGIVVREDPTLVGVPLATNEEVFFALASDKIDAAYYTRKAFESLTRVLDLEQTFVRVGPAPRTIPISIAVTRREPALLQTINALLAELRASGVYPKIRTRWFGAPKPYWSADRVFGFGLALLGAMTILFAGALFALRHRERMLKLRMTEGWLREQRALAHELTVANTTLKNKNEELQRLVYVVSHDLNSPLVSISGFAKQAERQLLAGNLEKAGRGVDKIARNASHMSALLRGIVDLGRTNTHMLRLEQVSLRELVDDLRIQLAGDLEAADAQIHCGGLPHVRCDRVQISRVLQNLVTNAIRHGCPEPGMTIEILARERPGAWEIGVKDNGPGVPDEARDRVFTIFQRLSEKSAGQGIGLAVVRAIAENHQGEAWVGHSPDAGATIWFSVSKGLASQPPTSIREAA